MEKAIITFLLLLFLTGCVAEEPPQDPQTISSAQAARDEAYRKLLDETSEAAHAEGRRRILARWEEKRKESLLADNLWPLAEGSPRKWATLLPLLPPEVRRELEEDVELGDQRYQVAVT